MHLRMVGKLKGFIFQRKILAVVAINNIKVIININYL